MAIRQSVPRQGTTFAANAAVLLLAASFAAPVVAAPSTQIRCDDVADASLEIDAHEFKARIVNHEVEAEGAEQSDSDDQAELLTPANYLTPEAATTVREAFQESNAPIAEFTPAADDEINGTEDEESTGMKSRLPGVTDSELARYRRQMYRIDI